MILCPSPHAPSVWHLYPALWLWLPLVLLKLVVVAAAQSQFICAAAHLDTICPCSLHIQLWKIATSGLHVAGGRVLLDGSLLDICSCSRPHLVSARESSGDVRPFS